MSMHDNITFSLEVCAKRVVTATCGGGGHCTRWGLQYNNECDFNSNDVGSGIGMGGAATRWAHGDWITCCQWRGGLNRPMSVMMWGRVF